MEIQSNFKLKGKAKYIFQFIEIIATTDPEETDSNWWAIRLWLRRN